MSINIKTLLTTLLLILAFGLAADYYESVENLTGNDLLWALRDLISTNSYSNYSGAKVFLFQDLDNDNGTVICVYTGENYPISSSYSGQSSPNTEHSYAQSWFSSSESSIKKADLHHLFITTMQVNSSRGNLPFGNVASTAASDVYYHNTPLQSYRGYNNWQKTVFQVNPEYRGNIARAVLYFYTRYNDPLYQGGVDMEDVLIAWHYADPPDDAERQRNNALHGFQNNRNPFVDRPEFVNRIWNPGVSNEDNLIPEAVALRIDNVYPNPFRDRVTVAIDSKSGESVTAAIYNLRGEKVMQKEIPANQHDISWDGRDSQGNRQAAGIYFIRISSPGSIARAKLLLIN